MGDHRIARRGVPLLSAMLALALVVGCSTSQSPPPSPSPAATPSSAPPATPAPTPTRVPRPTAAPPINAIAPASDQVVVHVETWSDIAGPDLGFFVYADGSIVDARGSGLPTVRPLTDAGLARLVGYLRDSGLFTKTRSIPVPSVPHGFGMARVTFTDAGRTVSVTASNVGRDAESEALTAIAMAFLDFESWFVPADWRDGAPRTHPYLPRSSRLTVETAELPDDAWINPARELERIDWPLAVGIDSIGDPIAIPKATERTLRCVLIDGREDVQIRAALQTMPQGGLGDITLGSGWVMWQGDSLLVGLALRAFLPHETPACAADEMPPAPSLAQAPRPSLVDVLVMGLDGWTPSGSPVMVVTINPLGDEGAREVDYYADGTILVHDPAPPMLGFAVRRLSQAGQAAIADLIDSTGLLEASWSEQVPEDAEYDRMLSIILPRPNLETQGRPVSQTIILNATDRGVDRKAEAVVRLAEQLFDPAAWLPDSAFVGGRSAVSPFRPAGIEISITHREDGPFEELGQLVPARAIAWPLSGSFETFGAVDPQYAPSVVATATLTPEEAIAVLRAFAAAGAGRDGAGWSSSAAYDLAGDRPEIWFEVRLSIKGIGWL
ncbi:MAG: hypothetical protein FIA92_03585 [Chloroflexi bacterium]|nr:hypothetical protein [Chloroflexota bacterium]